MIFLSQLLRGIAFVPALVNGIEGPFGGKSGAEKKDAAMSFLESAMAIVDRGGGAGDCGAGEVSGRDFEDYRWDGGMFECFDLCEGRLSALESGAIESPTSRAKDAREVGHPKPNAGEFLAVFILINRNTGSFDCASSFAENANELASLRMTV